MEKRFPLSVVIIAKNEEAMIGACLESVAWADEIVLINDESIDRTVEIAQKFTARIFTKKMENEGAFRNWAYAQAKSEWILSLDADEIVTEDLKKEIIQTLSARPEVNVFSVPIRNYIGNYWVRWGGWYPAAKDRLFRKGKFFYKEDLVHPPVSYEGACGRLKGELIHRYNNFAHLTASLNHQTTLEARKWHAEKRKIGLRKALWRTYDRFMRTYFSKKGRRDGVVGLVIAVNSALYQFLSYAKYWEILEREKRENEGTSGSSAIGL